MMTKVCKICKKERQLVEFYNHKLTKDGKYPYCITCDKKKKKDYYQKNKEKECKRSKEYYKNNKELCKIKNTEYRKYNNIKFKEYRKKFYNKNREKLIKKSKDWSNKNKERHYLQIKNWREENKERHRELITVWSKNNPHKRKEYLANYRAKKRNASIGGDLFRNQIEEIYRSCPVGYEVDHIIPLVHPEICGLHVPWNLQHLEKKENRKKGNKLDYLENKEAS
jgi:hypothetical protein